MPSRQPAQSWVATVEGGAEPSSVAQAPSAVEFAGKPISEIERKGAAPEAGPLLPVYSPKDLYNLSDKELLKVFAEGVADIPSALPGNGAPYLCHNDRVKGAASGLCRQMQDYSLD